MKKRSKKLSFVLSVMLIINLISIVSIEAFGSIEEELEKTKTQIISNASDYLMNNVNDNGRIGSDNGTINQTAEAVSVLNSLNEFDSSKSVKWIKENGFDDNNDTLSRTICATNDSKLLENLLEQKNDDGGFGLKKNHTSDVIDSVLVLEAINSCGSALYLQEGIGLCNYLSQQVNSDGSWSYTKDSQPDVILTSMVCLNMCKFMSDNSLSSKELNEVMGKSEDYLNSNVSFKYEKNEIEKNLYAQLALLKIDGKIDYKSVIKNLNEIQNENGSFYDSVHITSLVLKLLKTIDFGNSFRVDAMNTALSVEKGYLGKDLAVVSRYAISYYAVIDDEYTLKTTVTNGKKVIFENEIPVELSAEKQIVSGVSAEFTLNEMNDDGIVVKTELINSKGVLKSTKNNITLEPVPVQGKTELTDFALGLDNYYTYVGFPVDVTADFSLLYATNVENSVEMKFTVTKDDKQIAQDKQTVKLLPKENSFKATGIAFTPDVNEEGKYVVTAQCLYNNEVVAQRSVAQRSTEFNVIKLKDLSKPDESSSTDESDVESQPEPAPNYVVTWAGPVLSDYYLYAGKENKVDVEGQVLYYSNEDFNGDISIKVSKDENIVAENKQRVTFKKGEPTYFEGKANFPKYTTENFLSFEAKSKGEYKVEMEFLDVDGNVLYSDSRVVNVVEKPVQDLILNSSINKEKDKTVDLTWNDISNDFESYSYKLYRRIEGEEWESRSIWNESEKVKVLNIYPLQPYLKTWMTTTVSNTESPAGMGLFDIDSVHIATFNNNPKEYLLDENGQWKYDVLFFGSSDCNNGYDLSSNAAQVLQQYIDSGRGVLFGHDTICGGSSSILNHRIFNNFAEQLGLVIKAPYPEIWYRTTSVSVVNIGTLTNFPWTLRGNLIVPNTHSTGQYLLNGTEWITLNAHKRVDEETGAIDNFYLATKGNLGMIQTGDSTGQASDDERKIIANTLFYLYQTSELTNARDNSFYDVTAPDKADAKIDEIKNGKVKLNINSKDNPTKYEYYISADPNTSAESDSVKSNIASESALAGLKGYVVEINDKAENCPDIIKYDETNEFVQNIVSADENGSLSTTLDIPDVGKQYYVHIFSVDNENNVGEETIVPVGEPKVLSEIKTDKDIYNLGDEIFVKTTSNSVLFDVDADVNISIFDENGNLTTELLNEKDKRLSADNSLELNSQWKIPENLVGDYIAKITWLNGEKTLATASCEFNVAPNGKVNNQVKTDKKIYLNSEPVNIYNTVLNSSTNADAKDLKLNVYVYDEKSKEVASFECDTTTVQPKSDFTYDEVIKPGQLRDGKYTILAEVSNKNGVVSNDKSDFQVVESNEVITGDLKITKGSDFTENVEFTVKNESEFDITDATITVNIYPTDSEELVGTIVKHSDLLAGESVEFSEILDVKSYKIGEYIGVLSVVTANDKTELDRDAFEINEEYKEPQSSIDESFESESEIESSEVEESSNVDATSKVEDTSLDEEVSKEETSSANQSSNEITESNDENSTPNTGDNSVASIVFVVLSILCGSWLLIIRLMEVKKNEK